MPPVAMSTTVDPQLRPAAATPRRAWFFTTAGWTQPDEPDKTTLYMAIAPHTGADEAIDQLIAAVGIARPPDTSFAVGVADFAASAVRGLVNEITDWNWGRLKAWQRQMTDEYLDRRAPLTAEQHGLLTRFEPLAR